MYDDLIANQGSQQDGGTPDPSIQPQGGEPSPEPSKGVGGQEPAAQQQADDALPPVDDRGVPAKNVLSELKRKVDETMNAVRQMSENFTRYYNPQTGGYQPQPIPQASQQAQPQLAKMPTSIEEASAILDSEIKQKVASGEIAEQIQLESFRNRRMFELIDQVQNSTHTLQNERFVSENRIKEAYPDLNNYQSPLSQAVLGEIQRRASISGQRDIYKNNPYCLEGIVPYVASQIGIQPKFNGRLIQQKVVQPLPQNIGGRGGMQQPQDAIVPTEEEKLLSPRYGNDPMAMAKFNREHPDPHSISNEDVLLS